MFRVRRLLRAVNLKRRPLEATLSYIPYHVSIFFAIDHRTDTFSWGLKEVGIS